MAIDDIYTQGIAGGWKVRDASTLAADQTLEADVVIVGSGAGGGTSAEILSQAGLSVLIIEEGPLRTAADFRDMDEARAYAELYQEGAARTTADGAVSVLQGRSVGGTTTVNWTSSFRTPEHTLRHWVETQGLKDAAPEAMAPWFAQAESRLGIAPWAASPNANNAVLRRGAEKLGWESHVIPRNVRGCWNLGYCGVGCPTNAKQSMLVTTIPQALRNGATLLHHARVHKLEFTGGRVSGLQVQALDADCIRPSGVRLTVKARHVVLAGGAINTPALLLRSQAPDPHGRLGTHTCIHPVVVTFAQMPEPIDAWYGAPQSIASDEFQWKGGVTGAAGFKMEVPPLHPTFTATVLRNHGEVLKTQIGRLPHTQAMLALQRDGFHADSPGGRVRIDDSGAPLLDYELTAYHYEGFKQAYLRMAEVQFAAGAESVMPVHLDGTFSRSWDEARRQIENLPYEAFRVAVFTAHLMGGCAMGADPKTSVTNGDGRHHQIENLSVFDGSLFPTSIGANPQLSIYGFVTRHATRLAQALNPA